MSFSFITKVWKDYPDASTPLDANGLVDLEDRLAAYAEVQAQHHAWLPTNAVAQNFPRYDATSTVSLTSGTLYLSGGTVIPSGATINSISFKAGGTAAGTPTNQWFCLINQVNLSILAVTVDGTTTAWLANAVNTLNLSSPYTAASNLPVYIGIMVKATTPPNIVAAPGAAGIQPYLGGNSTAGLTTPASLTTVSAIGTPGAPAYAYLS